MDTVEKDLTLRELYYSPKTGLRGVDHLYTLARQLLPDISKAYVKNWLLAQHSYTKYKKWNNPKHYRKTFVRDLGEQAQVDLIIMQKHAGENNGYSYIFMAIEILSRYAFAIPMKRKNAESTRNAMDHFFTSFSSKFGHVPRLIQFDEGGEFLNKDVKNFLESHDVTYFSTYSSRKASVVERLNRTIKYQILKLFEFHGNHNWVDYLPEIIENYNLSKHRSIGMPPTNVTENNKSIVWNRLFGSAITIEEPKFNVGDKVRVLHFDPNRHGKDFMKYYRSLHPKKISKVTGKPIHGHMLSARDLPPFSDEIFKVDRVLLGDPVVYELYSEDFDIKILGKFYESELTLVR